MTTQAGTEGKKERGDGPAVFTYTDGEGNTGLKRVPTKVGSVDITAKTGVTKSYKPSELPQEVKDALVEFAFAARAKTFINNHAADDGSDVIELSDKVYADFMAGKIYSRSESGAKPGKKFDASIYANAMRDTFKFMAKKKMKMKDGTPISEMPEEKVADLKAKLEGMTPKERTAAVKGFKENKIYERALKELQARAIDVSDIGEVDNLAF